MSIGQHVIPPGGIGAATPNSDWQTKYQEVLNNNRVQAKRPWSIWFLVVANVFFGLTSILVFTLYFSPYRPTEIEISGSHETFDPYLAAGFLFVSFLYLSIAYGLFKAKRWSRIVQKIAAIPYLFGFPFGTIYALVALIKLNSKEASDYFDRTRMSSSLLKHPQK